MLIIYTNQKMKEKILLLFFFMLTSDIVLGKNANGNKTVKIINKNENHRINNERNKRSLDFTSLPYFLPIKEELIDKLERYKSDLEDSGRRVRFDVNKDKETPFWGTRGRRESASDENVPDLPLIPYSHYNNFDKINSFHKLPAFLIKESRDEKETPFWGNRGRRASEESNEKDINFFWANRGRRQDDEPFWGTRGRRHEESPFWGKKGRPENIDTDSETDHAFWASRGRRENSFTEQGSDDPFWPSRGRREKTVTGQGTNDPFWASRGRRENNFINQGYNYPFRSNCGSREEFETYRGSRGKNKLQSFRTFKEESEPFWGNRGRRKTDLKELLIKGINDVQNSLKNLATSRISILKSLLNGSNNDHSQTASYVMTDNSNEEPGSKTFEQNTVHDDRIFAEEPHYILVERSSRSSEEEDPFFISRGKKYNYVELAKASRGRRGALEEIVKSVRNDPYYIARGKRDVILPKLGNSTVFKKRLLKARDLICATVELLKMKPETNMGKREPNDNERDRRTILKKLALQLQMDPYFVSRGKKVLKPGVNFNALEKFFKQISMSCN